MKRLLNVMALSACVIVSGCSSLDSMNDTAVTDESIAALQQAVDAQKKDADTDAVAPPPNLAPPVVPPLNIETLSQPSEARFDVTADGLSANEFFMGLVQGTDYNMIVHRDVQGTVNLKLKNVTVAEVMEAMRKVYGYEYRKTGKLYQVIPQETESDICKVAYT